MAHGGTIFIPNSFPSSSEFTYSGDIKTSRGPVIFNMSRRRHTCRLLIVRELVSLIRNNMRVYDLNILKNGCKLEERKREKDRQSDKETARPIGRERKTERQIERVRKTERDSQKEREKRRE